MAPSCWPSTTFSAYGAGYGASTGNTTSCMPSLADGTYVPKMPPHRLGGGIYYRDINWLARVNLLHAFRQDEFATFDTPTPGYNMLNAELSYTTKLERQAGLVPEVTVGIRGENLLNDDVRNSVSYKKDEVLQPGANVRMFGSIKLN